MELTIKEYKQIKEATEQKIATVVNSILKDFEHKTEMSPYSVYVEIIETTSVGDPRRCFNVIRAQMEVDL